MPNLDGYGFMRRLRAYDVGSGIPEIARNAYARAEDAAPAFRAGYHERVTKPVDSGSSSPPSRAWSAAETSDVTS
jgi:CheY-like chemotaxis protein